MLNNIQFSGFVNPYLYVLFLITLPFDTPGWLLLILGFVTGISVDVFSNTLGMHASATVFLAFLRPYVLRAFAPRDEYQPGTIPVMNHYGFSWFFRYAFILVLAHHLFLFYVEVFSLTHFFSTLWRVIVSSAFTMMLIIVSQLFSKGKTRGR